MAPTAIERPQDQLLSRQLHQLADLTGDVTLLRLAQQLPPFDGASMATAEERRDWVDTCLMNAFRNGRDSEVFALLFERNHAEFLRWIKLRLRGHRRIDPSDVLQQVFLNICRYPDRFVADRASAFRIWAQRIVRNTLIGSFKSVGRVPCSLHREDDDEPFEAQDPHALQPEDVASCHERAATVDLAYLLFLRLYLEQFERLSAKEQKALTMVEVDGRSYREVAAALDLAVGNVKMLIFRARRRITRGATVSLLSLEAQGRD